MGHPYISNAERMDRYGLYVCPRSREKMGDFRTAGTKLCEENIIPGIARFNRLWLIPKDAEKNVDGRRIESARVDK